MAHLVDRGLEGAHDENGAVDAGRENERVGDGVDGGRVDDDAVELLAELADDLVHPLAHQQLGGVGRQGPGRQHVEVRHGRGAHRVVDALAEQHGGDAVIRARTKDAVQARAPQIEVDEQDARAGLGEGDGERGGGGSLALAGRGARDEHDARWLVGRHEQDVRANRPRRLGHRARGLLVHEQFGPGLRLGGGAAAAGWLARGASRGARGQQAQAGDAQLRFDVGRRLDGTIGRLTHEGDDEPEKEPGERADEHVGRHARAHGRPGHDGRVERLDVLDVDHPREVDLFHALENVLVELLVGRRIAVQAVVADLLQVQVERPPPSRVEQAL